MTTSVSEALAVLKANIRNPEGNVCREGIYDNGKTREALQALFDAHHPEDERQPIPTPGSQRDADALMAAGLAWYQDRECLEELPAEILDPIVVGNMVSIDVSTCDEDADYRVFGRIIEWQSNTPDGASDRVWLCDLDQFNYDPRQTEPQVLEHYAHALRRWLKEQTGNPSNDFVDGIYQAAEQAERYAKRLREPNKDTDNDFQSF